MPFSRFPAVIKRHALNRFIPGIADKKCLKRSATEKGPSHIAKMEKKLLTDAGMKNILRSVSFRVMI